MQSEKSKEEVHHMKLRSVTPMKIAKYGYIAISAIFTLAGLVMVFYPTPSQSFIGIFFGIAILAFGIIKLVGYWSRDLFRLAFQYDLQFGVLLCVLGIITLIRHRDAVAFLCVAYGICIMADSLFKIRTALDAKAFGIRQWWVTLVLAGLTALIGLLITLCPVTAARVVTVLLGISFVSEGLLSLGVAISMVKIVDNQQPDVIVSDDYEEWEES